MRRPASLARRAGLAIAALPCLIVADAGAQSPAPRRATAAPAARPAPPSTLDPARLSAMRWRMVGPSRGGRVTAATGVPSQPHTFYFGSTGGGVWKTTDAGQSWHNVSDEFFATSSVGAVEVSLSNPDVVYVGMGSDGIRSNVSPGDGVYRSSDAGRTWRNVGLRDAGQIGAVRVHPTNPEVVYVAAIGNVFGRNAERGVFRSRDGGATWQKVLYLSDSTGAVDLELEPGNPDVVYASMWRGERKPWTVISGAREGGIYKSTDGGDSWRKLGGGLPTGLFGKSNVAISAQNPRRVYALVEAKPGGGLYRSDDAGESWTLTSDRPQLITRPFYYINITADPTNADVVYVGTEGFYRSTDGGKTFTTLRTPHGDNHDLWINPRDHQIWIQANDGGVNVTLNGGRTWSTQYNQPTAEIYQVYVDDQFPYRLYGAQQDNSTLILPSLPVSSDRPDDPMQTWRSGPGCETGPIAPHRTNPDTVYGACKGQFSRMSLRAGQEKQYWIGAQSLYATPTKDLIYRFQRVAPLETSPHDPRVVYYGSQFVHRTRDEGVTWETISPDLTANDPRYASNVAGEPITIDVTGEEYYATLYAIRESPITPGVIWAGANDGPFHVTRDAGRTWSKITPADLPPGGRVQNIEPSPHRAGSAYYTVLRYLLGDPKPYVYKTDDYGKSWRLLTNGTNGIPANHPVRVVREDPDRPGLLYAGTEYGVFVSFDDGRQWHPFRLNLPATAITDMKVHRKDLVVSTQGRSFWILDDLTPLHDLSDSVRSASVHLVAPRDAWRMRYSGAFGGVESSRTAPDAPQYYPPGASINYWLGQGVSGAVTLDVLDARGEVVRSFSSAEAGERLQEPAEPSMRAPTMERVGTPRLPAAPGLNRFSWDLTMPGPWDASPQRSGRNGPMVLPGRYTLRLTAGGTSVSRPLVVRQDPRTARDGVTLAHLDEQLRHNIAVRDLVSDVNRAIARIAAAKRAAGAEPPRALLEVERTLLSETVRYGRPGLQQQISYLYGLTTRADQRIGRDAVTRYRTLRRELDAAQLELNRVLGPEHAATR